jgi:hypothetical protein
MHRIHCIHDARKTMLGHLAECQWPSGALLSPSLAGLSADSDVPFKFGQKRAPARSVRHGVCFQLEVQVGGDHEGFWGREASCQSSLRWASPSPVGSSVVIGTIVTLAAAPAGRDTVAATLGPLAMPVVPRPGVRTSQAGSLAVLVSGGRFPGQTWAAGALSGPKLPGVMPYCATVRH